MNDYTDFLKSKVKMAPSCGLPITADAINPRLKPHQQAMVRWLVEGGRRACFAAFGLGKSVIQLETVRLVLAQIGGRALIVCPLGVRAEFLHDAVEVLGWDVPPRFIRSLDEASATGIYLTNYETVRDGKRTRLPRQWVYTFKTRFVSRVRDERKLRTMRPKRKDGKRPAPGERISLRYWTGKPYWSPQALIHNSTVRAVSTVVIEQGKLPTVEGACLTPAEAEQFARYDGFEDFVDMLEWFQHEHGNRVELDMIEWEPLHLNGRDRA